MFTRKQPIHIVIAVFASLTTAPCFADAGDLDPTFGDAGLVTTDFLGPNSDLVRAVAVQADGKIVAVGFSNPGGLAADFALARYNPDGSLDSSFGTGGLVTTDFGLTRDEAFGVAIQSDGKIVAVGRDKLARYNTNGSLDSSFGGGGLVTTDLVWAFDIAFQADGKIVTAGVAGGLGGDFAVARYHPDGSPDGSFGSGGVASADFGGSFDRARALAIQADGKIVAVGGTGFVLARFEVDITTAVGTNVVVQPNDPTTGESSVTMTFDQVDQAGTTTVITSETGPTPPTGFRLASDPPTFYEITTTALFSGSIEVCIDYSGLNLTSPETSLSLMHFEDGEWVDATTFLDTLNDIICGTVSSLSPFVIMENLGLVERVLDLCQAVIDLNLQQGINNSLDAKLDAAVQAVDDINQNNDVAAINALNAFINAVEAQSGNNIPTEAANALIADALEIVALLSGG